MKIAGQKVTKKPRTMHAIRYFKKVGLGFQTPSDAIHGNYVDKKCPFTGKVSVKGRMLRYN
jgi:small subunit ribosomal protein S11e